MSRGKKTSWLFISLSLLPVCLPQTLDSSLRVVLTNRNSNSNIITLQCRLNATDQSPLDVMYFLNGSRLDKFTELQLGNNGVTFMMHRRIEGYFSCGNNSIISKRIALIAFPDSELHSTPQPKYAIRDEQVKLNCVIPPGRLIQQYYVTWYRSGTAIYKTRRNSLPLTKNDRYSVDPSDLSLIIDSVILEDANEEYHCVYTVFDPNVRMQSYNYESLKFYDIELCVLAPPNIERSTLMNRTIVEGENASFTCSAQGYPATVITWFLNKIRVLPQDRGILVFERSSQSGPYNVTTSELTIIAAQQKLNGQVKCLARSTSAVIDLPGDSQTAELVVLGSFGLRVDVTQKGDVLFEVTLPFPLNKPVKLIMEYVDLSDPFRRTNVTTNVAYIANISFLHLEPSSRVPFERFTVSVRLKASSVMGPAVQDVDGHAKNKPTLVDPNNILMLERTKHIIMGAVPGGLLLVVLVVLPSCFISYLYCKQRMEQIILRQPSKVLDTYLELIKQESLSEENRKNLIDEVRELTTKIIDYRNGRRHGTTPDTSHATATPNGIALSSRITHDGGEHGPLPPHISSQPSNSLATNDNNGSHNSQLEGSTESLVDKALSEFVRNLESLME